MAASKSMTSGKAKKSGAPRKAPKVPIPSRAKPNVMKEYDKAPVRTSSMAPMIKKRLSK